MRNKPITNKRGEMLLDRDVTMVVNDPDFRSMSAQAVKLHGPKWLLLLKRIDPIHVLASLFLIGVGVTAYVQ